MCGTVLGLAAVLLGTDVGWRRLPDGGMEYIIQIEPHMLDMLKSGEDLVSDIPPTLRGMRSWRITVGTDELPREGGMQPEPELSPWPESQPPYPEGARAPDPETSPEAEPPTSDGGVSGFPPSQVPRTLTLPANSRPLTDFGEKAATFVKQEVAEPNPPAAPQGVPEVEETEPSKPWLPLTLALAGLFGSFGGMLYVGWIAWDYRRQYRALLERVIEAGEGRVAADDVAADDVAADDVPADDTTSV